MNMNYPTGIRFGAYQFSEPELLPEKACASFLDLQGLYVVLVADAGWRPRQFRPLYFGESDGIWMRATGNHENAESWRRQAGLFAPLYRALCPLPGWTRQQRQTAESALIAEFKTPCNERLSVSLAALLGVRSR
jgi:hypothetical protein